MIYIIFFVHSMKNDFQPSILKQLNPSKYEIHSAQSKLPTYPKGAFMQDDLWKQGMFGHFRVV